MAQQAAQHMAGEMASHQAQHAAQHAAMDMAKDINEGKMPPPPEGMGAPPNGHQPPGGNPPPNQIEKKPDCRGLVFYMYQNFIKPKIFYFRLNTIYNYSYSTFKNFYYKFITIGGMAEW